MFKRLEVQIAASKVINPNGAKPPERGAARYEDAEDEHGREAWQKLRDAAGHLLLVAISHDVMERPLCLNGPDPQPSEVPEYSQRRISG